MAAMKTLPSPFVALALVLALCPLRSQADEGQSFDFIKTKSGKVYSHCRVFKTDPDGVMFVHQHGAAKILFAEMPEETRQMLGYDAKREADYEKARAEQKQKDREALWKYRTEVGKAQAAAYGAEAKRMEIIAVQNLATGYGGGYGFGYGLDGFGGYGYSPYLGYGNGYGLVGHGYGHGFGHKHGWGYPHHFGYHHGYFRGRTTLPTPANFGAVNVKGRTFFAPPPRANSIGTPAMGPLTPSLGGSVVR